MFVDILMCVNCGGSAEPPGTRGTWGNRKGRFGAGNFSFPVSVSLWKAYSSTGTPQQDHLLNTHVIFLLASASERGNVWGGKQLLPFISGSLKVTQLTLVPFTVCWDVCPSGKKPSVCSPLCPSHLPLYYFFPCSLNGSRGLK